MIFSSQASHGELAGLCRRVATSLEAGLPLRQVFSRETSTHVSHKLRGHLDGIYQSLQQGSTLCDAFRQTGDYFPPLLHEMLAVGEETGRLPNVLRHMADHYENQVRMRREFLAIIAWPMIQLTAAVVVVGVGIWILGMIASSTSSKPLDMFGLGLSGTSGMLIWFTCVGAMVVGVGLAIRAARRGLTWMRPLRKGVLMIPVVGRSLETLALGRLSWSLQLTLDAGMDVLRAVPLALRSTDHVPYTDQVEPIVRDLRAGMEIHQAMGSTGVFRHEFLDAIQVGEESGRLPEQLAVLARQYGEQARLAMAVLSRMAGFGVWVLVAGMIVMAILRVAMVYIGMINGFAKDPMNFNP